MKRFVGQVLAAIMCVGVCGVSGAFAAGHDTKAKDAKTKAANNAHSEAPATMPEGATAGNIANSPAATGESLQGLMSPEMTKWTTSMKACHKAGKTDQKCHNRVMKGCEAKLTKEECSQIMTQINTDTHSKM